MSDDGRRLTDKGILCNIARYGSLFWDWWDKRQIDKHVMAWATFSVTCYMVFWCMEFMWEHPESSGTDVGLKIAALMLPWTWLQKFILQSYFGRKQIA